MLHFYSIAFTAQKAVSFPEERRRNDASRLRETAHLKDVAPAVDVSRRIFLLFFSVDSQLNLFISVSVVDHRLSIFS